MGFSSLPGAQWNADTNMTNESLRGEQRERGRRARERRKKGGMEEEREAEGRKRAYLCMAEGWVNQKWTTCRGAAPLAPPNPRAVDNHRLNTLKNEKHREFG
ncbi:hypothetical protein E2C01_093257 [Portunus trituberculatus]|uniref:Uncharacterized protein n=1 Tax=Portunus trituberculatus TaxID=210409 RepID=A0A5B7JU05_PORTR|nr:hypothetical protein [Portunus trituberculatus]